MLARLLSWDGGSGVGSCGVRLFDVSKVVNMAPGLSRPTQARCEKIVACRCAVTGACNFVLKLGPEQIAHFFNSGAAELCNFILLAATKRRIHDETGTVDSLIHGPHSNSELGKGQQSSFRG